jgi:hypothetical protein
MEYPYKQIYLGTVITDLTLEQARWKWQPDFKKLILPHIHCLSPLRGYEHGEVYSGVITTKAYKDNPLTTDKGIVVQDFNDVMASDALVMYYLGAKNRSVGMSGEVAWAWAAHKPVVTIMEPEGNPNDHAFIREQSSHIVASIEEAAWIINRLLTPGL